MAADEVKPGMSLVNTSLGQVEEESNIVKLGSKTMPKNGLTMEDLKNAMTSPCNSNCYNLTKPSKTHFSQVQ